MAEGRAKKMWAIPGAELTVPRSLLMHGADESLVTVPCPSYLIEHAKGLVLFDTGCHPRVAEDPVAWWGEIAQHIPINYPKERTLDNQIKGLGYKLEDVKYVVISHLHLDHSGSMYMFPNAKFLIMAKELQYAYWPDPDRRWAFILNDLLPTRQFDWVELDQDFDMFGDGSLHLLKTPGHTPGESSLFVRLPNRKILLVGDTTHLRAALETEATMPLDTDPIQSTLSLKRIKAIRDMHEATLWISHDPEDWAELPHAPASIE
jgi:glyoxylase-like metal-dependent hydrolase (beta-lactamase superfamily II)